MKVATIIRYVGVVLLLNAAFMLISAIVAVIYGFDTSLYPLLLSFIITAIIGTFPLIFVPKEKNILAKEGYTIVIASWVLSCIVGTLPYIMWGGEFSAINALFESTSGYTTTGVSILSDVEALPHGLLFWRASTHWIGGVGVVLFALVVLPSVGKAKMTLSNMEISNLAKDNFRYNSKKLIKVMVYTYVLLTLAETIMLYFAGMTVFDAITQSFSTIATGGFSTKNMSIGYWDSPLIEVIIIIFMVLSGTHLGMIYSTFTKRKNNMFRSEVWRYYVGGMLIASILVAWNLYSNHFYPTILECFRYASFQVVSYSTTTGFASVDAAWWPGFSVLIMVFLSAQCAMAGSTSGGIKVDRIMLLFKAIRAQILQIQHPNAVIRLKLNNIPQENSTVNAAVLLVTFYVLTLFASTLLLSIYNIDLLSAFTASVACLGNVGPGFGEVGNLANLGFLPSGAKFTLAVVMLFGRLELFGLIHIFLMQSWK